MGKANRRAFLKAVGTVSATGVAAAVSPSADAAAAQQSRLTRSSGFAQPVEDGAPDIDQPQCVSPPFDVGGVDLLSARSEDARDVA